MDLHPAYAALSVGAVAAHASAATALGAVSLRAIAPDTFDSPAAAATAGAIGGAVLHGMAMPLHSMAHCGHPKPVSLTKTLLAGTASSLWAGTMGGVVLGLAGSHLHAPIGGMTLASLLGTVEVAGIIAGLGAIALCFGFNPLHKLTARSEGVRTPIFGGSEAGYETP